MTQRQPEPRSDAELAALVEAARGGDQAAYTALYEATSPEVYRTARSLLRSEEQAVDAQQDTYVYAFTHLDCLGDPAKLRTWLRTIAVNRARSALRRQTPILFSELETGEGRDIPEQADPSPAVSPELCLERKENAALVNKILERLTPGQQAVVGLYYYEQMSVDRIAETLGVTPGTVKTQLHRSRKRIEEAVRKLEAGGISLCGLAPLPFLVALLRGLAPAPEASAGTLAGVLSRTGAAGQTLLSGASAGSAAAGSGAAAGGASVSSVAAGSAAAAGQLAAGEAVAVHVGRRFLETVAGKILLGLLTVSAIGGGIVGYNWYQEKVVYGDTQPPYEILGKDNYADSDENFRPVLTTAPTDEPVTTAAAESSEDLPVEPGTTEPVETTEPTEPVETTEPTEPVVTTEPTDPVETTEPTEPAPKPTEPTPPPVTTTAAPPRLTFNDEVSTLEVGKWTHYHVNVKGDAVPVLYTDHPEVLKIEAKGQYSGGSVSGGETGYFWYVKALEAGEANLYCVLDGETRLVSSVNVPLPPINWNPDMPPVDDTIIDFEEETEP